MTKQISIAIVVPDLTETGGVQTITDFVVRILESDPQYKFQIFSLATSANDDCSTQIRKPQSWFKSISTKHVPWKGRDVIHVGCHFSEIEFMRYQPRKVLSHLLAGFDLIQVVGGFPAWGLATLNLGIPVLVWGASLCKWERKTLIKEARGLRGLYKKIMTKKVIQYDDSVVKSCDRIMVMNSFSQKYVRSLVNSEENVVYTPAGVDIHHYTPTQNRNFNQEPYILSVARFNDSRKNALLLLQSYLNFRSISALPHKLILAGATAPPENFWQKVSQNKVEQHVQFIQRPDATALVKLYQNATCTVISSDEEGFGMVAIESMACAVPVVSTRCGGPEDIISDTVDGYLTPLYDADAIAEKLHLLCKNQELNTKMGQKARQKVESQFSESVTQNIFKMQWEELL